MVLSLSVEEKAAIMKILRSFNRKAICLSSKRERSSSLFDWLTLSETSFVMKTFKI